MNNEFYTVIENQIRNDGSKGLLYDHYDSIDSAYAKLFAVLAEAAVSGIPYHAAFMIDASGNIVAGKIFDRRGVTE